MPAYDRAKLDAELSRDEGRAARPYKDSLGILTVGIGLAAYAMTMPEHHDESPGHVEAGKSPGGGGH